MTNPNRAITIRGATAMDAVVIVRLLKEARQDMHASRFFAVNDHKAVNHVLQMIETALVAVADLSGRVVGTFCGYPAQPPWSDDWMFRGEWFYVVPACRDRNERSTLLELLTPAERVCDQKGLPLWVSAPAMAHDLERVLAGRAGYVLAQGFDYLREPQGERLTSQSALG